MRPAIVLLSGGLDSTTALAIARDMGFAVRALTLSYGQRNSVEVAASQRVAQHFGVLEHKILSLDLRPLGGSSLTSDLQVKPHEEQDEHPDTYVPARNTIMLSLALAYAEVCQADDIFFGAHVHDYSGYCDCRPAYIEAYENMANLATKRTTSGHRMTIHAPLVDLNKAQIIGKGLALGVKYELTMSCYDPQDHLSCGRCSACFYRRQGFMEAGVKDPTKYV